MLALRPTEGGDMEVVSGVDVGSVRKDGCQARLRTVTAGKRCRKLSREVYG